MRINWGFLRTRGLAGVDLPELVDDDGSTGLLDDDGVTILLDDTSA